MTEAEWLECRSSWMARYHPRPMLDFLRGKVSSRKLRLFALACCRRIWHLLPHQAMRTALEVTERHVEGLANDEELREAIGRFSSPPDDYAEPVDDHASLVAYDAGQAVECAVYPGEACDAALAAADWASRTAADAAQDLQLFPVEWEAQARLLQDIFGNPFRPAPGDPSWRTWNGATVAKVAEWIYEERAFDRLPILADALEEAGCDNEVILSHLRGPGPHVRGCWVVDLLTSRE